MRGNAPTLVPVRPLLSAVIALLLLASAASADQKVITSTGPLTSIYVNDNLACNVDRAGVAQIYGPTAGGSCGTFLEVGGTVYGPSGVNPTTRR